MNAFVIFKSAALSFSRPFIIPLGSAHFKPHHTVTKTAAGFSVFLRCSCRGRYSHKYSFTRSELGILASWIGLLAYWGCHADRSLACSKAKKVRGVSIPYTKGCGQTLGPPFAYSQDLYQLWCDDNPERALMGYDPPSPVSPRGAHLHVLYHRENNVWIILSLFVVQVTALLFAEPLMLTEFSYWQLLSLLVLCNFPKVQFKNCYIFCSKRNVIWKLFDE